MFDRDASPASTPMRVVRSRTASSISDWPSRRPIRRGACLPGRVRSRGATADRPRRRPCRSPQRLVGLRSDLPGDRQDVDVPRQAGDVHPRREIIESASAARVLLVYREDRDAVRSVRPAGPSIRLPHTARELICAGLSSGQGEAACRNRRCGRRFVGRMSRRHLAVERVISARVSLICAGWYHRTELSNRSGPLV